ncbi:hypothetical protein BG011_009315 [Mortierella polycephala]|uniref:Thymocyte nuclear protein 1 n=1 Tax=Mortierella polycephala TaxID=41804 RepID=A0A9P6TWP1_9FUNG|nr:hypothetical protein BG011_009315 [Mortierella polycephala]
MNRILRTVSFAKSTVAFTTQGQAHAKTAAKRAKVAASEKQQHTGSKSKSKVTAASAATTTSSKVSAKEIPGPQNDDGSRIRVWLMKSEPAAFSMDDLINSKDSTTHWDGVRNHEAKNLMKNNMKIGDRVLFYHSNVKEPGIVGLAKIVRESYPDHTAFDSKSHYYDTKSSKDDPRWFMVDVQFSRKLKRVLTLNELQQYKDKELSRMMLLRRGRLSVQPVTDAEMEFVMGLEEKDVDQDKE